VKGLIFSSDSVPKVLDGTKTMTRRILKLRPDEYVEGAGDGDYPYRVVRESKTKESWGEYVSLPFKVGERRYVKEKFKTLAYNRGYGVEVHCAADGHDPASCGWETRERLRRVLEECPDRDDRWRPMLFGAWRSPLFMPQWASRAIIEVVSLKVERVQDISEEDAKAEGVEPYKSVGADQRVPGPGFNGVLLADQPHRLPFADLWDRIHGDGEDFNGAPVFDPCRFRVDLGDGRSLEVWEDDL
jgi:hypothetical protein